MTTPRVKEAFLALAILSAATRGEAQDSVRRANRADSVSASAGRAQRLLGVYDQKSLDPIEGVQIIDMLTSNYVFTSSDGLASLNFVRTQHDSAIIHIRKLGYRDSTFVLLPTDTALMVFLDKVQILAGIETKALAGADIEARARHFGGRYLSTADLRNPKYEGLSIGELLERIHFTVGNASKNRGLTGPKSNSACRMRVFLDGDPRGLMFVDMNKDDPHRFASVEFYPNGSAMPVEFTTVGANACGVLAFWSRVH